MIRTFPHSYPTVRTMTFGPQPTSPFMLRACAQPRGDVKGAGGNGSLPTDCARGGEARAPDFRVFGILIFPLLLCFKEMAPDESIT